MASDPPSAGDTPELLPNLAATAEKGTVPGPTAIAGALLFASAMQRADLDQQTRNRLLRVLGDTVPTMPLRAGAAGADRSLPAASLRFLVSGAAVVAAGLDPAKVSPPAPPVLWTSDAGRLLVRVGEVTAALGTGTIVVTIPVTCDETGPADVTVTFVTGSPEQPSGGIATTEDHPRGPAVVVENWAEPLVAYAWHTVVLAVAAVSGAGGNDISGRNLVSASVDVSAKGVTVKPMGRHTFFAGGTL